MLTQPRKRLPSRSHCTLRISTEQALAFWDQVDELGDPDYWSEDDFVEWSIILRAHFGREVLLGMIEDRPVKVVVKRGGLRRAAR